MKDPLAKEIKENMDKFFAAVTDDEFVAILDDLDWKHYATLGPPPILEIQLSASAKPSASLAPKPWNLRHRSVPIRTAGPDRLAA